MGTHPIFESDFDCLTENMAFSKTPRVLINDEMALNGSKAPGPGDYNPKGLDKRIPGVTIHTQQTQSRQSHGGKANYLSQKDTSTVGARMKSMVQVSRGKLKQMEKQLEQAAADSERLAVTEAQLDHANEEKVRLSDEIERKNAEINELTGTNETLNEQVNALRNELKQLNKQLLEVIKQIEQHEVNIGQLRHDAHQLLDDNEQLKAANTVTNQQLAQATKQLDEINAENAALTTELKSSKEDGVKMSEQKEHLSRRLMSSEGETRAERTRSAQFQAELDGMQQELRLANDKIGDMVNEHTKSSKTIKKLDSQLKAQSDQIKRARQANQDKDAQTKQLEVTLKMEREEAEAKLTRMKKSQAKEKSHFKAELGDHLKTIDELKTEIDDIRHLITSSTMYSALMEERLTSETYLTAEMEKLLDLNKKLSVQNDAVMGELNVEKEQMKELIQIHLDYEDELEERWSEIIGNVEEIRKLQDQLQVHEMSNTDNELKIKSLVNSKRKLEKELEAVSARLNYVERDRKRIDADQDKVAKLTLQLEQQETTFKRAPKNSPSRARRSCATQS